MATRWLAKLRKPLADDLMAWMAGLKPPATPLEIRCRNHAITPRRCGAAIAATRLTGASPLASAAGQPDVQAAPRRRAGALPHPNRYRDRLPPLPRRRLPPVPALGILFRPIGPAWPPCARAPSSSRALPATGTSSRVQGPLAFLALSIPIPTAIPIPMSQRWAEPRQMAHAGPGNTRPAPRGLRGFLRVITRQSRASG